MSTNLDVKVFNLNCSFNFSIGKFSVPDAASAFYSNLKKIVFNEVFLLFLKFADCVR